MAYAKSLMGGAGACCVALLILTGCAGDKASGEYRSARVEGLTKAPTTPEPRLELLWRHGVADRGFWQWKPLEFSTPAVCCDDERVIVGSSSGEIVAVEMASGDVIWTVRTDYSVDARPEVADGKIFVGNSGGEMLALDTNGNVLWRAQVKGEIDGSAAYDAGRVFFMDSEDVLHAFDAETGEELWDYQRQTPDYFTIRGAPEPYVDRGIVYAGFADGRFMALDALDGSVIWGRDLTNGEEKFTDIDAVPTQIGDSLLVSCYSGGLYNIDIESGSIQWRADLTGASTVTAAGDVLYTTTARRRVVALDKETGKPIWKIRHDENIPTSPVVLGDYLIYGGTEVGVFVVDRRRGVPLLEFDPAAGFQAPVATSGPNLLLHSNNGFLYNFELVRK